MNQFKEAALARLKKKNPAMNWQHENKFGMVIDGRYEGELKSQKPNGLGRWKQKEGKRVILGEWQNGMINGKAIEETDSVILLAEMKNGQYDGRFIKYSADRKLGPLYMEYKEGKLDGKFKFEQGKVIK